MAVSLVAAFVGIANYRIHRELRIFLYYSFFSLITDLTEYMRYAGGMDKPFPMLVQAWTSVLFMVFEFLVFSYFILSNVKDIRRRRAIKALSGIFLICFVMGIVLRRQGFANYWEFYFWESIFLTIPCLIYFYELFTSGPEGSLKALPAFWVITGILMLNCSSIPLYLTLAYMGKYLFIAYNLIYLLYASFFFMVIRANRATG